MWQIFGYSKILEYFPIYEEGDPFSVNNMCTFFITNLHHRPPSSLLSKESWGWKFTSRLSGLHIWSCLSPRQPTLPPSPQNYSHHLSIILNKKKQGLLLLKLFLNYTLSDNMLTAELGGVAFSWGCHWSILPDLGMPSNHTWQIWSIVGNISNLWASNQTVQNSTFRFREICFIFHWC